MAVKRDKQLCQMTDGELWSLAHVRINHATSELGWPTARSKGLESLYRAKQILHELESRGVQAHLWFPDDLPQGPDAA